MKKVNDTIYEIDFESVVSMFEKQVEMHPDKTAVISGSERKTYGELNADANRVADVLIQNGVAAETIVAVLLERGIKVYTATQGILKAGGAFTCISAEYPRERVRYILEDSGAKWIITDEKTKNQFGDLWETLACTPLIIDEILKGKNTQNPNREIHEKDLCYVIYTSGSTGKPKGVMIEQGNLSNFVNANPKNRETLGFTEKASVVLALATITFDVSIMEEFIPLTNGMTVVIATEEEIHNLDLLADTILRHGVDSITTTPSFVSVMLEIPKMREALKQVRSYDLGAEAFQGGLYDKICAVNPEAYIMNGYGPTETTISCTMKVITSGENITIGIPNANVLVYIIDENNNEVPDGQVGELLICGKGVGRGYRNLPEKTAEVFIEYRGMRGYKSGDLALINAEGEIEFHGRKDNQVKLRGFRIELGEVEEVILSHADVLNAVAVVMDEQLCVYYTATKEIEPQELSDFAAESLAYYMVPDILIQLEEMPLTANHKIDKKSLPKPILKQGDYEVPKNKMQQKIFDIVASVTNNSSFGINTPFYRAGLTSLGAMKLNVLLAEGFGIAIKTSDITQHNTVALMEEFIRNAEAPDAMEIRSVYPLTGSQKGIFAECAKNPETTIYNIPFLFTLDDSIEEEKLADAVARTIQAHSYMTARFGISEDGEMVQKPFSEDFVPEIIRTTDSAFDRNDLVKPFQLEGGRLFRITIYLTETKKYLFVDFHHIMADGNSYDIFFRDLNRAYMGEELAKEDYTGFDAAVSEEYAVERGGYKKAALYYDNIFQGLEVESLPIFDKKGDTPKKGLAEYKMSVSAEAALQFCERMGITPNTLFTGVFGILMSRWSNAKESLFATIYNGRNDSRLENTICMLVKTLPVYCKFDDKTTVVSYMVSLQEQLMNSMANDIFPFSDIAAKYGITSDLIFAYQAELTDDYPMGNTVAVGEDLSLDLPKEPLLLQVRLYDGEYYLTAEYRSDLYLEETVQNIMDSYNAAFKSIFGCRNVSDVTILSEQQEKMLDSFNETEVSYDVSKTVVDMFEAAAAQYPDNTAVVYEEVRYTYSEVEKITRNLAGDLIRRGLTAGDVAAVLIPRCEYMAICSMGVARSGCACQPLDHTYPQDRLLFMLEDSGAKLLITTPKMRELVSDYTGQILYLDEIPDLPEYMEKLPSPKPEDLFTLLYTSGSTGVPKGCMIEYGNITAFCTWYHRQYEFDSSARLAAYASYGFDASMMDIFTSLTAGAQLNIIAEEIRLDLLALCDYFEENQLTHSFMTTQVGRQFAMEIKSKTLRHLSTGGEKLVPLNPPEGIRFYNVYGPTECTVYTTIFEMDRYYDDIPIGKPLDNLKLYIVDDKGHRLPAGASGELLVSGRQVSRGYLNRPEKTKEVYAKNPYTDQEGYERMYHTGDVVRYLNDGNISFVGRRDAQVKIRGFRIELTEVEEVIRRFPGIKDATVAAFDEEGGGKYIAAYVVSDEQIDTGKLNAFIMETKPPYMVPAVTMQIDRIPLNQNQKVNRRALPKPQKAVEEMIPPKNEMQQRICDCIAEAIGHREFGITTDIQLAGLTSISAIKLNVLLAKNFDVAIKTNDIRENPTVVQLERFLLGAEKSKVHEVREVYPLTNAQAGIFVDCTANMGTTVYNIPYLFRLSPRIDLIRLKEAIEQTVEVHPYLKVQLFMDEDGEIRQRRNDHLEYTAEIIDGMDREKLVRPFPLFQEPLFCFEIHRTHEGSYLFLDVHHLIADGTSLSVILSDIDRAYQGEKLTAETYTAYDAALDNERAIQGEKYKKAEEFYASVLKDCSSDTSLYPDKNGEAPGVGNLRRKSDVISREAVQAICEKYGITENVFFTGIFGAALARYHFASKSVFTTIYHGRNDSRLSDTIGMFVKTLPVVCDTTKNTEDYFVTIKNQLMGMMDHDIYPFQEISRNFHIKPDTMFVYQGGNFAFTKICGEDAEEIPLGLNAAKEPISLMMSIENGEYIYELEYRSDLFEKETAEYLIENLEITTRAFLDGKEPSEIRLLFDEQDKMVNTPQYMGKTFIDLFREAVSKYPDNTAVKDENGTITYAELDAVSEYIADKLKNNGFGREKVAGILCGRTRVFVEAYVGIMKAGGAYVPLDPEYPQERIEYMLSDSGSENLLLMRKYGSLTEGYDKNVIYLDEIEKDGLGFTGKADLTPPLPENLAYMIYTSGSTGKPKGVMLEHRNLMTLIEHTVTFHETVPEDMYGEFSSFCFDASVHDLFVPLTVGASLYIFPESVRKDAVAVCRTFENEPITVATMPTQMGELVAETLTGDCALRLLTLGGEKFKRYYDRKYMMVNGYGPTENTVSSTEFVVDRDYKTIPIGKSQLNVRCYIVDENLKRVPVGAPGELCVAGRQVARGYHNLPEKTASVFVPNPFATCKDEERLYHTGDMVRMKGDGNIEYIGRIDSQIKINGFRVELGEIEGALLKRDGVCEVAAIPVDQSGVTYIAAYYTGAEYKEEDWKAFLSPLLPEYMVPAFYTHLDKMPVTPGGKIDKRALPAPAITEERTDYAAPQTGAQIKLCKLFEKALGREKVGIDDDFFAIGGTSLAASKVAVMCLNEKIPLVYADIFKYPTVRALARALYGDEVQKENTDEFANYSYNAIDTLIAANNRQNADCVEKRELGDILITGATGFLGIHVLKEFLDNYDGKAYCMVRKGRYESNDRRLMNMLMYYFDLPYTELFGDKIICIDSDITDKEAVERLKDIPFTTLINCAACVKHFAAGEMLEKINVTGVKNLIDLCSSANRRLIQISTISVGGEGMDGMPPMDRKLAENDLYFGQRIANEYIRTKFLAERAVLEAAAKGLDAKVIRVGNLMSRHRDGEFQINFITNGFLRSLRGYAAVGAFPMDSMNEGAEFSPIDETAAAVLCLAGTGSRFTVFHACNNHRIFMSDVIYEMRERGFDIKIMPGDQFIETVNAYAAEHETSDAVSGLIAYTSHDDEELYTIDYDNAFTTEVLYRLGFKWNITDNRYLAKAIEALEGLNFFEDGFSNKL